jgi:RNA polymerase sigma factor for flagellar operon FliA
VSPDAPLPGVEGLWAHYKDTDDRSARDRLVVHYSPLVKYVAGRVHAGLPASVQQDDLISDGLMGLMGAIGNFELDRGLQFQTYAVPRIRGAIIDGLRGLDWVPRLVRERMRDINAATATLEHRLQRRPREPELAEELGISERELRKRYSQGSYATLSSIDSDHVDDDVASPAIEGVSGAPDGLPAGFLGAIRGLPDRDQIVVALYYWEGLSLAEIGQVLVVSESRVSQLMTRATLELRRRLIA